MSTTRPLGDLLMVEKDQNKFEIVQYFYIRSGYTDVCREYKRLGGEYNEETKRYEFQLENHDLLIQTINQRFSHIITLKPLIMTEFEIKITLFDENNFQIKNIHHDLLNLIDQARVSYRNYENKKIFNMFNYEKVVNLLRKFPNCSSSLIPNGVVQMFKNKRKELQTRTGEIIDKLYLEKHLHFSIFNQLKSFQIESVCFGIQKKGRLILADDMGLGKTLQSLAIACYYNKWPILIITTKTGCITWREEINKWLSYYLMEKFNLKQKKLVDEIIVTVKNEQDLELNTENESKIYICNYTMMKKFINNFKRDFNFELVILDESQRIKNKLAKVAKVIPELLKEVNHVMLLSGIPAYSYPNELYTQLNAIDSTLFVNSNEFENRYCDARCDMWMNWKINGHSNLKELKLIMNGNLLIRREKKELNTYFPNKERKIVYLDILESSEKLDKYCKKYLQCREFEREELDEQNRKSSRYSVKRHKYLKNYYGLTCEMKLDPVCEYVKDMIINETEKMIVVAHHRLMLNSLKEMCEEYGFDYMKIDGDTSLEDRVENIKKFKTVPSCRIAILSFFTLNTLSFNEAKTIIFAELYWTPGIILQAEDRIMRIGQDRDVNVQYLIAKNTSDPYMWNIINNKLDILRQMGLSKEALPDIENLSQLINNRINTDDYLSSEGECIYSEDEKDDDLSFCCEDSDENSDQEDSANSSQESDSRTQSETNSNMSNLSYETCEETGIVQDYDEENSDHGYHGQHFEIEYDGGPDRQSTDEEFVLNSEEIDKIKSPGHLKMKLRRRSNRNKNYDESSNTDNEDSNDADSELESEESTEQSLISSIEDEEEFEGMSYDSESDIENEDAGKSQEMDEDEELFSPKRKSKNRILESSNESDNGSIVEKKKFRRIKKIESDIDD